MSDPRSQLVVLLPDELRGKLSAHGSVDMLAKQAIILCLKSGYTLNPPALRAIVRHLIDMGAASALLPAIEQRLAQRLPMAGHAFDEVVLGAPLVFIDREPLRALLRAMSDSDNAPPILVVEGEEHSGKSFLATLIEHYCSRHETDVFCPYKIESEEAGKAAGPLEIATDFVTDLEGDPDDLPPQTSNAEAWHEQLANHVLKVAKERPSRVWFVIDGFKSGVARDDSCKFLVAFANKFRKGYVPKRHRLILTDFARDRKADLPPVQTRSYENEPVEQQHVEAAVTTIVATSTAIPETEKPEVARQAVAMVLDGQTVPLKALKLTGERLKKLFPQ